MNVNMWEHAATQENIEMLRTRGVHIVSPDGGFWLCGMVGEDGGLVSKRLPKPFAPRLAFATILPARLCRAYIS